jgi:hypothetical protein
MSQPSSQTPSQTTSQHDQLLTTLSVQGYKPSTNFDDFLSTTFTNPANNKQICMYRVNNGGLIGPMYSTCIDKQSLKDDWQNIVSQNIKAKHDFLFCREGRNNARTCVSLLL